MIYLASDLHIGNDQCAEHGINRMLNECLKRGYPLYVIGDVFDFVARGPIEVFSEKCDLVRLTLQAAKLYVIGNHDEEISPFATGDRHCLAALINPLFGTEVVKDSHTAIIDGKKWLFVHGHMQSGLPLFYKLEKVLGWSTITRKFARYVMKSKLSSYMSRHVSSQRRIVRNLLPIAKKGGYDVVVFGHTHICMAWKEHGIQWVNTGCGIGRQNFIKYDNGQFIPVDYGA